MSFLRKNLILLTAFLLIFSPAFAKDRIKILGDINTGFSTHTQDFPEEINILAVKTYTIPHLITIPEDSMITLEFLGSQKERRWHKSGFIVTKLKSYTPEGIKEPIDVSRKDIYLILRKYEPIDKKEAVILGTEIVVMSGASYFAPGVDVGYFFLKGVIAGNKHKNRFVSGVHNAYENSICWFWLKGKPIDVGADAQIMIKNISQEKAVKMVINSDIYRLKQEDKYSKRIAKRDRKTQKRWYKYAKKDVPCSVVERAINAELEAL